MAHLANPANPATPASCKVMEDFVRLCLYGMIDSPDKRDPASIIACSPICSPIVLRSGQQVVQYPKGFPTFVNATTTYTPTQHRILVVDDEADTRTMLSLRLQREGYSVTAVGSGEEALAQVRQEGVPSLVLLDILLPDMDGFAVAGQLREVAAMPIIFLSALSDTERKVEGINLYAEDYVTKPFAFSELLARIQRVLVRSSNGTRADPEQVIDEQLRINFAQNYAVLNDKQLTLTPTEVRLIHTLYSNRGRVLSAGFLLAKAWEPAHGGTVESLWVHIRRLRNKIEPDPENPRYVVTVRGQGYCLPQRNRSAT